MANSYDEKTLSYSQDVTGWPSFYSFIPDYMVGMNSFFYTFRGGNLYRHNTNLTRNNYYNVQYNSTITSVFNREPSTIKLFKTMSYESDDAWECTSLFTEIGTGSMLDTYFVQKEREWFTYLRENTSTVNFKARSTNGIGDCTLVAGVPTAIIITIPVDIDSILSVGDYIYSASAAIFPSFNVGVQQYAGQVTNVDRVLNTITINETIPDTQGTAGIVPLLSDYILFVKNAQAESHGARGYFMQYTLENNATTAMELFSVGSNVMKSFP
tara:strand:- start:344 stop:1150 length:807 start_codon:yes stop_codon:yes gene_type:complete